MQNTRTSYIYIYINSSGIQQDDDEVANLKYILPIPLQDRARLMF